MDHIRWMNHFKLDEEDEFLGVGICIWPGGLSGGALRWGGALGVSSLPFSSCGAKRSSALTEPAPTTALGSGKNSGSYLLGPILDPMYWILKAIRLY